jgi:hypothetical protein
MEKFDLTKKQYFHYAIAITLVIIGGAISDIATTCYALRLQGIFESNPIVASAMVNGTWLFIQILVTGANIITCWLCVSADSKYRYLVMMIPLSYGVVRAMCTINNIWVIVRY